MEYRARQRAYSEATDTIKTLPTFNEVELASSLALRANKVLAIPVIKDKL
jgi:hypothetical protein